MEKVKEQNGKKQTETIAGIATGKTTDEKAKMQAFNKQYSACIDLAITLESRLKLLSYRCIAPEQFVALVKDQVTLFNKENK